MVKHGKTPGTYSVINPMMPRQVYPGWTDLSLEQAEDLASSLVGMWEEDRAGIAKNNDMAAESSRSSSESGTNSRIRSEPSLRTRVHDSASTSG